jgi:hypothetical protein
MTRFVFSVAVPLLVSGCALVPPTHLGGIATTVSPTDYAERLCAAVDLESYATCMNEVLEGINQRRNPMAPGDATSGPFAVIMEGDVYVGSYWTAVFVGRFSVSTGNKACRGEYNAFTGSADAIFDVYCDDGRSGWADLIRSMDGRNGIGKIALDDGTEGEVVFGRVPLGDVGYSMR